MRNKWKFVRERTTWLKADKDHTYQKPTKVLIVLIWVCEHVDICKAEVIQFNTRIVHTVLHQSLLQSVRFYKRASSSSFLRT